jgi:hypothetical protein
MAVGKEGYEQAFNYKILANNGFCDFCTEFLGPGGAGEHGLKEGGGATV